MAKKQGIYGPGGLLSFMGLYPDTFPHTTPYYEDQRFAAMRANQIIGKQIYPEYPTLSEQAGPKGLIFNYDGPGSIKHRIGRDDLTQFDLSKQSDREAFGGFFAHGDVNALKEQQDIQNNLGAAIELSDLGDMKGTVKKAFSLSLRFEGKGGYSNVTGNFDKQGVSFGFIQFNFGQGTLQRLLQLMYQVDRLKFVQACGSQEIANQLLAIKTVSQAVDFCSRTANWQQVFRNLGAVPDFQKLQVQLAVNTYVPTAKAICARYGLKSERGFALALDIAIQNGSIETDDAERINTGLNGRNPKDVPETELLVIIGKGVVEGQFAADVLSRKMTIATGKGTVHGVYYDLDQLGITLNPFEA